MSVYIVNTRSMRGWTDEQLVEMGQAIDRERWRREEERITNGDYEPMNERERELLRTEGQIRATVAYKTRVGCLLTFAKSVVLRE